MLNRNGQEPGFHICGRDERGLLWYISVLRCGGGVHCLDANDATSYHRQFTLDRLNKSFTCESTAPASRCGAIS